MGWWIGGLVVRLLEFSSGYHCSVSGSRVPLEITIIQGGGNEWMDGWRGVRKGREETIM